MLFAKRIKLPFVDWYLIKGTELKNVEKEVQELIRKNKISNKVTSIVLKKVATGQIQKTTQEKIKKSNEKLILENIALKAMIKQMGGKWRYEEGKASEDAKKIEWKRKGGRSYTPADNAVNLQAGKKAGEGLRA